MQYKISHEVYLEIIVDAPSMGEAEALANRTPYGEWEERYVVREDCVALSESPINPRPA